MQRCRFVIGLARLLQQCHFARSACHEPWQDPPPAIDPAQQLTCRALPAPLIDASPKRRCLQQSRAKTEGEIVDGDEPP